ncbi:hypothetical protein AAF712_000717 [Marasmius tenuissimus]|uniref:Uncharacterized protein n=1 Tax=Marasmius tenuissimus TaxID=585030 RepID=A0ABR3AE25_9AGAR
MNTGFSTSNTSHTFSTHLKRTHTQANPGLTTSHNTTTTTTTQSPTPHGNITPELPALPQLRGEYLLQVFTHKSLRRSEDISPEEFEDNERLSVLGEKVLSMAVTHVFFKRRPLKKSEELLHLSAKVLDDSHINTWVTAYKLREKVRCTPDAYKKLSTPEETRLLFYAFAGGLYVGSGLEAVCRWLDGLLGGETQNDSTTRPPVADPGPPPTYRPSTPPQKRMKAEAPPMQSPFAGSSNTGVFFASQPPPTPSPVQNRTSNWMNAFNNTYPGASVSATAQPYSTTRPGPQLQGYQRPNVGGTYSQVPLVPPRNPPMNPLSPAQPHLAFLPLFNQTASQRKVKVDYQSQFSGPSHAGKWTVQCVVNGIPKGMGAGMTKQVAKEEAARQAFYSMGWA